MAALPRSPSLGNPDFDGGQEPSGSGGSTAKRGFFSRALTFRSLSRQSSRNKPTGASSVSGQTGKGPLGLTGLYTPPAFDPQAQDQEHDPDAHIVFVHGLGGGSEHTWSKGSILWPRDLLPAEEAFANVSIYTFGYDSDFRRSNILGIHDFAKSLLSSLQDDPMILASRVRFPSTLQP